MSKLLGSLLKTASKLPNAGQAGKVAAVAVGAAAAVQVAGTVARKVAEKKANAGNAAAAGGPSASAAPQPAPHMSRKERKELRNDLLKQAISGHGFPPGTNPYARPNGASSAFSTTDISPTNQRQAREQIVAWADVGLQHLLTFYSENKGKMSEAAEDLLWQDIELLGKAAVLNRQYGSDAGMEELKGYLERVRCLADSYGSRIPKDKALPNPVATAPALAKAEARLASTPELAAEVYGRTRINSDVRDIPLGNGSSGEDGRKQALQVTVAEGLLAMCEMRKLEQDPDSLKPASMSDPDKVKELQEKISDLKRLNGEAMQNLQILARAMSDSHKSMDALSTSGDGAERLVKRMRSVLQPVKDGQVLQTGVSVSANGEVKPSVKPT